MMKKRIFLQNYQIAPERLWIALKEVLDAVDGLTLVSADDAERKARFRSGVTSTSWGQNMDAVVEAEQSTSSRLMISSQVHTTFLSSRWGESVHEKTIIRRVRKAIEVALAEDR
jgi:hypothetical protein